MDENFGLLPGLEVGRTDGIGVVGVQYLRGHRVVDGVEMEEKPRFELTFRECT